MTKQSYVKDVNYIKHSLCRYLIMNMLYRWNIKLYSNADVEHCVSGFLHFSNVATSICIAHMIPPPPWPFLSYLILFIEIMLLNVLLNGPRKPSFPGHTIKAMTPYLPSSLRQPPARKCFPGSWPAGTCIRCPLHWHFLSAVGSTTAADQHGWLLCSLCSCSLQHKDVDFLMFCCWVSCTETEAWSDIKHPPIFGDNI